MGLFGSSRRRSRRPSRMVTVPQFTPTRARASQPALSPTTRVVIKWIAGGIVLYLFLAGPMGAWNLMSLWRAEDALAQRELELQAEIIELQVRHDKLESDTLYIERVARNEYNLAHPSDIIYDVEEAAP